MGIFSKLLNGLLEEDPQKRYSAKLCISIIEEALFKRKMRQENYKARKELLKKLLNLEHKSQPLQYVDYLFIKQHIEYLKEQGKDRFGSKVETEYLKTQLTKAEAKIKALELKIRQLTNSTE